MSQEVRYPTSQPRRRSAPWSLLTADKRPLLPYLAVCAVGIVLGVATAVAATLPVEWIVVLIIAVVGTALVAVFGNLKRLLLATVILNIPLQMDGVIGYKEEISSIGAVSGWLISLTTVALAGLYVLWLIDSATTKPTARKPARVKKGTVILPLLYLGFNVLSLIMAQDMLLAGYALFQLVQLLLLFVYISNRIQTEEDVQFIVTMLLVGLIVESLIMIAVWIAGRTFDLGFVLASVESSGRVTGTLGSPNSAGGYVSMALAVAMCTLMIKDVKPIVRWLATIAIGLGVASLILTLSRGSWVAFAVACLVIGFVALRQGWLTPSLLIGAAVVLVLLIVMNEGIIARVLGNDSGAAASRIYLNKLAFNMIRSHPLLGVGTNNFTVVMYDYQTVELSNIWLFAVHNKYLLIWAETGIGALVSYVLFLLYGIQQGWMNIFKSPHKLSPVVLGLMAGIIGHMAHMFVDIFNRGAPLFFVWVNTALIVAITHMMARTKDQEAPAVPATG